MGELTREDLLRPRFRKERVELDSIGGYAFVRQLSGLERVQFERNTSQVDPDETDAMRAVRSMSRLVILSLVDEQGNQLLQDSDLEAVTASFPFEDLEFLFKVCLEVNGLSESALEDAVKN